MIAAPPFVAQLGAALLCFVYGHIPAYKPSGNIYCSRCGKKIYETDGD